MSVVRTVLGDIESSELGFTMAHEHVFMDVGGPGWNWLKDKFLPRLLDEGFSQETIDDFMIHNPARFYSMREK